MKIETSNPDLSRGVEKNGQEIGIENELKLLECIKTQGWVREYEAGLITKMSAYTVGQVSRRLAQEKPKKDEPAKEAPTKKEEIKEEDKKKKNKVLYKDQIYRERVDDSAGYFLRLRAAGADRVDGHSGKDITIPKSWSHDALAIQTLHYLSTTLNCEFETDASMRHRLQSGKLPDGRLISDTRNFYFEQERSKKSGANLRKQTETITRLAALGTICFVAYPYPPKVCGGINHEIYQTNSIRQLWGSPAAQNIKLVRCHFASFLAHKNMRVSQFEIIELPAMFNTVASKKGQAGVTDQVMGFKWSMTEHNQYGQPHRIVAILRHGGEICFEGVFTRATSGDDFHSLESGGTIFGKSYGDLETFDDFVRLQQKEIERSIQGDIDMCAMQQARAEAEEKIDLSKFDLP